MQKKKYQIHYRIKLWSTHITNIQTPPPPNISRLI